MGEDSNILKSFSDHIRTVELVKESLSQPIKDAGQLCAQSLADGGTIFWCGNGGSASDSQHLAAELVGRFKNNRRALRSVALSTDTSVLTCVANDFSYSEIFSRQIEALGRPGDILVAISTSGDSENVINAIRAAKEQGVISLALLGKDGGACKELSDKALVVPSSSTARIQESHILIGHILCQVIEEELGFA